MKYLGIDIGGTAVKMGIVTEKGEILNKYSYDVAFDSYETPIFETVKNEFDIIECSLNDINQKNLNSPSPKPVHYEDFQRLIAEKGFEYCLKKYGSMKRLEKIRRALSPVKQRLKIMIRH